MPEPSPLDRAAEELRRTQRQLLDAAAFGKQLSPEQLERAAGRIGEALRVYAGVTSAPARQVCDRPRRHR
ncbi:DUF6374 family protein [Nocardia harenae]|uniref:DUF6374 family protein n=1 Tax=Nocardia harenae TaxID=358707 RepID=UPI00083266AF|nr:DUF6374 family protein [Nocardia harenae]